MRILIPIRSFSCVMVLAVQFVMVFSRTALAGISAPNSSAVFSADGRHILVMRSPYPADDNRPDITLPGGRVAHIRDCFAKSGAYDAATLAPEWTVDWFCHDWELLGSADFQHIVRLNRFGIDHGWAIAFHDRGKLIQTYDCKTLLTGLRQKSFLPFETWDWHTRWYENLTLNSAGDRVSVSTARRQFYVGDHRIDLGLQEFYEFDISSGTLLSTRISGGWAPWAYLTLVLVSPIVLFLTLWQLVRLVRRLKWFRRYRGFPLQ
jgi:hypothetical protein